MGVGCEGVGDLCANVWGVGNDGERGGKGALRCWCAPLPPNGKLEGGREEGTHHHTFHGSAWKLAKGEPMGVGVG